MHEMGITAEVLKAVGDAAEREHAVRVNRVTITIGGLTAIMPEALQFAWEALTPGTIVEGAVLEVVQVAARSRCGECQTEFEHDQYDRICPSCGNFLCEVIAGNELRIDAVDVDLPEDAAEAAAADGGPTGGVSEAGRADETGTES
jgi:hydrogenase nickel incorporation protein HypA/HybF